MHQLHKDLAYNVPGCSSATDCRVARGDYLVNSGNIDLGDMHGPPLSWTSPPWYPSPNQPIVCKTASPTQRSEVRVSDIVDGTSKTAWSARSTGSRTRITPDRIQDDNQCVYSGHNSDTNGYTGDGDGASRSHVYRPRRDQAGTRDLHYFGSAHLEGLHMAYCDGSVHFIEYDVDGRIWYTARWPERRRGQCHVPESIDSAPSVRSDAQFNGELVEATAGSDFIGWSAVACLSAVISPCAV